MQWRNIAGKRERAQALPNFEKSAGISRVPHKVWQSLRSNFNSFENGP